MSYKIRDLALCHMKCDPYSYISYEICDLYSYMSYEIRDLALCHMKYVI